MKNIIKKIAFCGVLFVGLNYNDALSDIKENRKVEAGIICATICAALGTRFEKAHRYVGKYPITAFIAGIFGLIANDSLR